MIRYSDGEGIVRINGLHFRDGQNKKIVLPHVAIGVFSRYLYNDVIEKFSSKEVGYISCANYESNVYIIKYKDFEITFFMAHVGACRIADDIEQLKTHGVDTFIIFGNCGVLDKSIEDCSIIIPTLGFREEGTSYHYIPASATIDMNPKYVDDFIQIVKSKNFSYVKGCTWTTDAPYRETRKKVDYFKNKGCVCVEMEGTAIAAVCQKYKLNYFTLYYAGDNLDSVDWEERSISGLTKIEVKKEVVYLAFDLAIEILEK